MAADNLGDIFLRYFYFSVPRLFLLLDNHFCYIFHIFLPRHGLKFLLLNYAVLICRYKARNISVPHYQTSDSQSTRRSILCCLGTLRNGRSQRISARASSAKGAGETGKYYSAAAAWENVSLWPSGISYAA